MRGLALRLRGDLVAPIGGAAILAVALAMQALLMPVRHIAVQFPPPQDNAAEAGALPQFALPPGVAAERAIVDTTILPPEAAPDETATEAPPSVAMAAADSTAPWGADEAATPSRAAALPGMGAGVGAGNLHLRLHTGPSGPLSLLANDLKAQIERLHPMPQARTKRVAALSKPERPALPPAGHTTAKPGKPSPAAVPGIGGTVIVSGSLGGLAPLVAKEAPILDGTDFKRRF